MVIATGSLGGIENKCTIVDGTLIWSEDFEENFNQVCNLFEVCSLAGLIFNPDKFQFGQNTVCFAGLDITPDGVRPSSKLLESIRVFPPPSNILVARSFFDVTSYGVFKASPQTLLAICLVQDFRGEF